MPNWCDNAVTVRHTDKSKIDALDTEMSKKNKDGYCMAELFQHLRPRPAEEEGNWYSWNCDNWGTKWDANIIDWERRDDNEIWISFETAWSPPIAMYDYLVEEGWEVDGIYNEPGCAFAGLYSTDGGDDYYEYDITDLESLEDLPSDIIEFGDLVGQHEWWKENNEDENEEEVD